MLIFMLTYRIAAQATKTKAKAIKEKINSEVFSANSFKLNVIEIIIPINHKIIIATAATIIQIERFAI